MKPVDVNALTAEIVERLDAACLIRESEPSTPTPGVWLEKVTDSIELTIRRYLDTLEE